MLDRKKVLGFVSLVVTSVVTTLVSTWMTDREIEMKVNEALSEKDNEESE